MSTYTSYQFVSHVPHQSFWKVMRTTKDSRKSKFREGFTDEKKGPSDTQFSSLSINQFQKGVKRKGLHATGR